MMSLKTIKYIIFDFDGTIANSQDAMLGVYQTICKKWNYPILEVQTLRNQSSRETLQALGISPFRLPRLMREARLQFQDYVPSLQPIEGIKNSLLKLKGSNYQLGILTSNSDKNVNVFLQNHELKIFDFVFSGASLFGKGKLLKNLLYKKKVSFQEAVYIGDEVRDINAARTAGVQVVSVSWGVHAKEYLQKHEPDYLVDDPEELTHLFVAR